MRRTSSLWLVCLGVLFGQRSFASPNQAGIKPLDRTMVRLRSGKYPLTLTFDDGPSSRTTPRVLEVLRSHRVPATFFVVGQNANTTAGRAMLRQMVDEGHTVGNHTQTHPASSSNNSATLSPAAFENEVRTAGNIIMRATDVKPAYFRFPGGFANDAKKAQLRELGYTMAGWHTDPWDWWGGWHEDLAKRQRMAPEWMPHDKIENFIDYAVWAAKVNRGGLFLLHDIKAHTATHLDALITKLKANFEFVTISNREAFPIMNSWLTSAPHGGQPQSGSPAVGPSNGISSGSALPKRARIVDRQPYLRDAEGNVLHANGAIRQLDYDEVVEVQGVVDVRTASGKQLKLARVKRADGSIAYTSAGNYREID